MCYSLQLLHLKHTSEHTPAQQLVQRKDNSVHIRSARFPYGCALICKWSTFSHSLQVAYFYSRPYDSVVHSPSENGPLTCTITLIFQHQLLLFSSSPSTSRAGGLPQSYLSKANTRGHVILCWRNLWTCCCHGIFMQAELGQPPGWWHSGKTSRTIMEGGGF